MSNSSEQVLPVEKTTKGTDGVQTKITVPRQAISHVDYWGKRLRKRAYQDREGRAVETPEWYLRLKQGGLSSWFNMGTANKAAAAAKAKEVGTFARANGLKAAQAKFKPEPESNMGISTVGDYLDAAKTNSPLRQQTLEIYARKFRTLLAGAFGVKDSKTKYDYVNGGRKEWIARLHRIRLDRVTVDRVERWKIGYLKAAEQENPLAYKHARTTLNSIVRGSKALFSKDVIATVKLKLPEPLPMAGVGNVPVERQRYRSKINAHALLLGAKNDLATESPEPFKILLLALGAGLRRDEIDNLTWKQIDFERNLIQIETTKYGATKSSASEGEVDVDPGLLTILKEHMKPGAGEFVIKSESGPRPQIGATYHYRCERHFNSLIKWLRGKGVDTNNPLHTLRKEFGCQIAAQGGIFAASMALRHADIQLTRDYYLDKKQRTAFPISDFLKPADPSQKAAQ